MNIRIPEPSLVLLIGASCSERSEFARKHFDKGEVFDLGIDDDQLGEEIDFEEFEEKNSNLLARITSRIQSGKLVVIDAPNVLKSFRKFWIALARDYYYSTIGIVFLIDKKECVSLTTKDKKFAKSNNETVRTSFKNIKNEFDRTIAFRSRDEVEKVVAIERTILTDIIKPANGPFDIIGDVHGCFEELKELLLKSGYLIDQRLQNLTKEYKVSHPGGRKAIFVGDLVDRGPDSVGVLRLVMDMVKSGVAYCVPGNHDDKLMRKLQGRGVQVKHGLEVTMEQFLHQSKEFETEVKIFISALPSHLLLDEGKLVVAHAGIKEEMQGRNTESVREFCMYGDTTGKTDENGTPISREWWKDYNGKALVVYGHSPVLHCEWVNNTIDIDTGCVFGGFLTALKYPEKSLVSVWAKKIYSYSARPDFFDLADTQSIKDEPEIKN